MRTSVRNALALAVAGAVAIEGAAAAAAAPSGQHDSQLMATPIQHVVVIFQENVSFDHYFATYPNAANTDGQPFHARPGTPSVNGLTPALLTNNPNTAQPKRLTPAQAMTCDQNHGYTAEQKALDGGLMDAFVQNTNVENCSPPLYSAPGLVMDYYDGNTVTGLWNYAQRFAMSDNSYGTTFGPSTPGALNLVSGQTAGAVPLSADGTINTTDTYAVVHQDAQHVGTVIRDPDPFYDDCANHSFATVSMNGPNIGDLLNARRVTWGWFEGGFAPTSTTADGTAVCGSSHKAIDGVAIGDYIAHHEPFEYYKSTANIHHVPPASLAEVGHNGQANHQYDISWFGKALNSGNLPAVSFVKAPAYQDGHAAYSDPIDEQNFLASTVNSIEHSRYWHNTAIVIGYDDSDGWYDHAMPPILNSSADPSFDALNGTGVCGHGTPLAGIQDRCGYGQRLPLLVISPYAKSNFVDGTTTDQTSILRFIEDNWLGGERIGGGSFDALAGSLGNMFSWRHPDFRPLFLNPATGEPVK
ncbi:MAG: phospholipase C [Micromonosporaceae bacterium]